MDNRRGDNYMIAATTHTHKEDTMSITNECKKTAAIILKGCGISCQKLTAKEVSFEDLARGSRVFVTVHGINLGVSGAWDLARATAKEHGFILTTNLIIPNPRP
jgi:hypothetical protein